MQNTKRFFVASIVFFLWFVFFPCVAFFFVKSSIARAASVGETSVSISKNTTAIVFWHSLNATQTNILKNSLQRFTKRTGILVKLETGMDLRNGLLKQKHYGALPDVVLGTADFMAIGKEVELSSIPIDFIPRDVGSRFVKELSLDNVSMGVPLFSGNHLVLYSNASIVSSPAKTWEEIFEQHAEIKRKGFLTLALPVGEPYFFLPFVLQAGVFADGVLTPNLQNDWDKFAKALDSYSKLITAEIVPSNCSFSCSSTDFLKGKFAYTVSGDWLFADALAALGSSLRVSDLPSLGGKPMRSISSTQGLFFPGRSLYGSNKSALQKLVRHLLNSSEQYEFARATGRLPATDTAMEKIFRLSLSSENRELLRIFKESQPMRSTRESILTWMILSKALEYRIQNVAPTSAIVETLRVQTIRRLQQYREEIH